ncbi:MAG: type II toxin-antitoxin system RelE/ParE family toxin [Treponema sp.]|nr:type II toxin-antitoxin system RelE/ParE family toxin [Treponema sp.]
MKKYTLRYLPLAQQDLFSIVDYIQNTLQNPIAAENTLLKIESAILDRLESPESFAIWHSRKKREYPYRRINVGNYTVWYVVIDTVMEIRRILYSRRDEEKLL